MKFLKFFCITLLTLSSYAFSASSIWQYNSDSRVWFQTNPPGGPYFFGYEWPTTVGSGGWGIFHPQYRYQLNKTKNAVIWEHYGDYSSIACQRVDTCNTNEWVAIDNNPQTSKIVSENGVLYQLHTSSDIWAYSGGQWRRIDSNPDSKNIVMAGGILYQIHSSHNIFRYDHIACANKSWPDGNCWERIDNNSKTREIDVVQYYKLNGSTNPIDSVLIQFHL